MLSSAAWREEFPTEQNRIESKSATNASTKKRVSRIHSSKMDLVQSAEVYRWLFLFNAEYLFNFTCVWLLRPPKVSAAQGLDFGLVIPTHTFCLFFKDKHNLTGVAVAYLVLPEVVVVWQNVHEWVAEGLSDYWYVSEATPSCEKIIDGDLSAHIIKRLVEQTI